MSIKMTNISVKMANVEIEWTDTGCRILATIAMRCHACKVVVAPNVEHRCGDMVLKPEKPKRRVKAK